MTYDAENHLNQVKLNGVLQAMIIYDGDGKRVVSTVTGGNTIRFIGNYYEYRSSTSIDKYYFAGSQRVAMRDSTGLTYILGDHLGSTSITTNASGVFTSELRYRTFGDTRYTSGGIRTYRQTGGLRDIWPALPTGVGKGGIETPLPGKYVLTGLMIESEGKRV